MTLSENEIRDQIFDYLRKLGLFVWRDKQPARKQKNPFPENKGVADILGITKRGVFFAIEVKTDSGKLYKEQHEFLESVNRNRCIGIVASSVEEVKEKLNV